MKTITIGIIGAGYIGREHARSILLAAPLLDGQVKIVAIGDTNLDAAKQAAKDFSIEIATDDIDSILENESINTIFSCVPTKFHLPIIEKAVKNGKAVFCEKPFATNLEDAEKVHDLLTKSGAPHQVGFVLRYAPVYRALANMIKEQSKTSPLRNVSLRDDQVFPIQGIAHFTSWRNDANLAGAGVLIEHGIHDIDLFEFLFGKIKRVSAREKNFHGNPGIEDYIEIRLEFEDGLTASMLHIWHDIPAHQAIRRFELFFNHALITLDKYNMDQITMRDKTAKHIFERPDLYQEIVHDPLFKDLEHKGDILYGSDFYAIQDYWFLRNMLENKQPSPSIDEGLRAFKIAHACYDSAKNDGAWVNV